MSLENYSGISEARKAKIFDMTDAELLIEIEKGKDSIMPKCIPFMRAVLSERNRENISNQQASEQEHREAILRETQISNSLSKEANDTSSSANRLSIIALVISLIAIVISLLKGG